MTVALILIDERIDQDLRVIKTVYDLGKDFQVVDIRTDEFSTELCSAKIYFTVIVLIFQALWIAIPKYSKISGILDLRNIGAYFYGMPACIRLLKRSLVAVQHIQNDSVLSDTTLVYSNDLYCAVVAMRLHYSKQVYLIYDSHELQIQRNRKNGLFRILIEYGLEQMVLRRVNELLVVNQAILTQMCQWYELPLVAHISYNDFFKHHSTSTPSVGLPPVIVYIGQGVKGRQLERLESITKDSELSVNAFFIGEVPAFAINAQWNIGPRDYEDDLVALVQSQRCMMWCCVENICLSYQLALPNKFFQALAVCMPVIVSKDTYLSEIVNKYKIGIVLDDHDSNSILEQIKSDQFIEWVENITLLRNDLSKCLVIL